MTQFHKLTVCSLPLSDVNSRSRAQEVTRAIHVSGVIEGKPTSTKINSILCKAVPDWIILTPRLNGRRRYSQIAADPLQLRLLGPHSIAHFSPMNGIKTLTRSSVMWQVSGEVVSVFGTFVYLALRLPSTHFLWSASHTLYANGLCFLTQAGPIRGVYRSSRENVSGPRMSTWFIFWGEKNQTLFAELQIAAGKSADFHLARIWIPLRFRVQR